MILSTLVHYRNLLKEHTPGDMSALIRDHVGHALHLVQEEKIQFPGLTQQLICDYQEILQSFSNFTDTVNDIQQQLRVLINEQEQEYFIESQQLYSKEFVHDSNEYILHRRPELSENAVSYIHSRIKLYGDWRYAGLIIRPGLESWIHHMVGCDPLYLVDHNRELLNPVLDQFNQQYQNRLRKYTVDDLTNNEFLPLIPDNQIGFCLAYNYFNFKPIEVIKVYLVEIYNKLKPGGTVAFTFNNCDYASGVKLVERKFMCYTPGTLIMSLSNDIGYDLVQTYKLDSAFTWVELRKPGALSSLRGGQSLARIVAKSK